MFDDGDGEDPHGVLPPRCPVTALGHQNGVMWFLDHANQVISIKPDCRKGEVMLLFGGESYLRSVEKWAQWRAPNKAMGETEPQIKGFDQALVQADLIAAAAQASIFDPQGLLFGRGAHRRQPDDALVLHAGNKVLIVGAVDVRGKTELEVTERPAGRIDGKIYPALRALPAPAREPSTPEEAVRLKQLFNQWYFFEPDAAPLLLLGYVGQALICGALSWRAHVWLTGETAAGKSTLQKVIRAILDDWGIFTEDASEAAVRQLLKDDTLPVMIDEAEADDRADRQTAMINLARKASSGAKMHRGSSDHRAQEFTAQSAFLFSSILHAPLDPQDRNRFAILAMRQVPADAKEPDLNLKYWREAGRRMQRRMIEQWPRFDRTLATYKDQIRKQGFQGRWRDTFGTLLAFADMLLHDCAPSEESELNDDFGREVRWVQSCLPLMQRGAIEAEDTTTRCITHLTSSLLPASPGQNPETIGRWITRAMEYADKDSTSFNTNARNKLRSHGLRVVNLTKTPGGNTGVSDANLVSQVYVLIAGKTNTALKQLFAHSKWYDGGWQQALQLATWTDDKGRVVKAEQGIAARFTGRKEYALAVPIEALVGPIGEGLV
jgi:hypothetical protein